MEKIKVNYGVRSYEIQIGSGVLQSFSFEEMSASKYVVITDSNVKQLYGESFVSLLKDRGLVVELIDFPAGEKSKTWKMVEEIGKKLAKSNTDRDAIILALGGGVVGDLSGFVASVYMRGIRYVHIPTTLLAQVDSSIGGKTGVNIPEGKNLLGTFYQPQVVVVDPSVLETLSFKEIQNGLAEVIKYAVTQDKELFEYLEKNIENVNKSFYDFIILQSVRIKAKIVEQDEHEGDLRKILNYGHTVGHAIEILSDHKISHGQAVAIGMVYESKIANCLGFLSDKDLQRQNELIEKAKLNLIFKFDIDAAIEIMKRDKKSKEGKIYFVLPDKIGGIQKKNNLVALSVDEKIIRDCLAN